MGIDPSNLSRALRRRATCGTFSLLSTRHCCDRENAFGRLFVVHVGRGRICFRRSRDVVGLTNAKTGNAAGLRTSILYTLLSRATMMSALHIVGGIHETQLPKLRADVQKEMKRILRLSESMLERFHDGNESSMG